MSKAIINSDKITERLKRFNYKYQLEGTTLVIYLSMLCYLKINLANDTMKITSHVFRLSFFDRLEYVFLMYAFVFYLTVWYLPELNNAVFVLLGIIMIYLIVCFVKTENMKKIIHHWIETDTLKKSEVTD